ncbi:MAG: hypothetical protein DI603_18530 [Roseateles depolymerans]|uniref:diguanylate cyclase n=1 Tax=Roseateles depolymerans TaxID=76731 RepID=A0A2W5DJT5_9BURK|nr:MAG: hypothetical protein DI603_18530 [Roseateles depolymerans]
MNFSGALFTLLPLQALAAALVLTTLVGWRGVRDGGRWAQAGMLLLALGLVLHSPWWQLDDIAVHAQRTLGLVTVSAGLSALWEALARWLAPQAGRRLMWAAPLLLAAGHGLLWPDRAAAQALADLLLAAQLAGLGLALARPGRSSVLHGLHSRRWRLLGLSAMLPLLAALLLRAAHNALGEADLATTELVLALAAQLAMLLVLPMLLLAWRAQTEAELARLAQTDGLTGLIDRDTFERRSVEMFSLARRHGESLTLIVMEVDNFTMLQTEQGVDVGDRALALFASCLQAQMRLGDLTGRIGPDRFGVLMVRCQLEGPQALDARMRQALAQRAPAELGLPLAFSGGWAKLRPGDRGLVDLQRRAETALYEARQAGRGQLMAEPGLGD